MVSRPTGSTRRSRSRKGSREEGSRAERSGPKCTWSRPSSICSGPALYQTKPLPSWSFSNATGLLSSEPGRFQYDKPEAYSRRRKASMKKAALSRRAQDMPSFHSGARSRYSGRLPGEG